MKTNYFYLDESGCYTTDIKKAKATVTSNGVFVKPKCFVDKDLKIVSNEKDAVAIVNIYSEGVLQILLLESGGTAVRRHTVEEMCKHYADVLSYRVGYHLTPELPTNETCLLANFMEEAPLITSCHTKTDIIDQNGKIKLPKKLDSSPHFSHTTTVPRSIRTVVGNGGATRPNTGYVVKLKEDENFLYKNSYPAALISLKDFEAINNGTDFLNTYLYFCE